MAELVVALAIFLMVLGIVVSIFVNAVRDQRRNFLVQDLQDNGRYMMETMIKEIRMSTFISLEGGGSKIRIINQENETVSYEFPGTTLTRETNSISSSKVNVTGGFYVAPSGQSRVTIRIVVKPVGQATPEVKLQNTITLRKY